MTSELLLNMELALEYALDHIHMEIGSCSDVRLFADYIGRLEDQRETLRALLDRVQMKLGRP